MGKLTAAEVLTELAQIHGLTHSDGTPNFSAMAQRTGIYQPTISRIMSGGKDWEMSTGTISKLCDAFHITFDQAKGEAPLSKQSRRTKPTAADLELIREIRSLDTYDQEEIQAMVAMKVELMGLDTSNRPRKRAPRKRRPRTKKSNR